MKQADPFSFEAFRALLADALEVDPARITPEAHFITDLGVDSLRLVQALLYLEAMDLGSWTDMAWQVQTVEEAYRYYLEHLAERKP
ncbi:MAG: acyl carrier protein [Acidobacteria bacterium]|nr:acyl carrier protein [Acidobacteriota bacterium]